MGEGGVGVFSPACTNACAVAPSRTLTAAPRQQAARSASLPWREQIAHEIAALINYSPAMTMPLPSRLR
ncbi:hypothetical protein GCM10010833_18240 [Blastomonas aquatica]|uniref:Uncharacterized protein n=1 Tax=Blastomonas aquatica TaxID=1510276 RepID=A0ABQ1J9V3_9SPHN|nr:hypothetical protein GCM10010833_18240 [Blastomonas aquatica]